ncbi:D-galactarate dehydratase/Altronate hydrolase domain protein [Gemmatirosa kalamazoonensis]|uniref:D-galactarate dehydratase/Altronate hydrolase domain protein n=1 Tax=Gemmatirosa kalamazoonensis TaxID=861299 RepID=W0RAU8_9BACT|nr:altronate dehydratase family protein [Gemmatirosa kalamazoonensis]AHG87916.1 D-galactarate dehydratase/Altronate hydrolase domain protein [Gemmatirosa kalamazoonensis]
MTEPVTIGVSERVLDRAQQQGVGRPTELPPGAPDAVRVHPSDDVAVAVRPLAAGTRVDVPGASVTLAEDVPAGHKIALRDIAAGEAVVKYGMPIGAATAPIAAGAWIHSHNMATRLSGAETYEYHGATAPNASAGTIPTFDGYRRPDGRVGTRNEVWIINTVGCVNTAAERIAKLANERYAGEIDGVFSFSHPYGCSQLGDDLKNTQKVLAGLARHPNAGGVLVLGLGCENNQMASFLGVAEGVDRSRLRFFNSQDVVDELETGVELIGELVAEMKHDRREPVPVSELVIGHKCGGSDGFSGITANALLGRLADRLTAMGGGVILTEVPEMFGAEQVLLDRAASREVFDELVSMVNDFKEYFIRHGQPVYENPSPGNKAGGLTTLEEKSLGAIQKGGRATVTRILRYGERAAPGGLSLLEAPGNDGVSSTAMTASGATVLLFTTGRGTPLGFPVPTVKVSSNSPIAERKPHWIDFNAGRLLDGTATMDQLTDELLAFVIDVASGRVKANNEKHGYREIAIWKEGVTL